jgi:hypothetical protein
MPERLGYRPSPQPTLGSDSPLSRRSGGSPSCGHGDYATTVFLADPLGATLVSEIEVMHGEPKSDSQS